MAWGYSRRPSTKPSADQEVARSIALDAFLEGKIALGKSVLEQHHTRLSKPQAKKAAVVLMNAGRADDAMAVLMMSMGKEQAQRELAPAPTATVGDILYTSWGYDQTNVDFYQVIEAKGATATIRKIAGRTASSERGSDYVVPQPGSFIGAPKKKRVQKDHPYTINMGDGEGHAHVWDGKPKYQTASGYGH